MALALAAELAAPSTRVEATRGLATTT